MANANTALVRQIIEEMGSGNPQAYFDRLAEDVRYTVIGSTPFSGTCQGRNQLVERVVVPLMEKLDGFIKVTPQAIFGDGDLVCVQAKGEARTKNGEAYNNTYCFVFRLRDDKIVEVTEYMDTDLVRSVLC
jgi:ketosteroid isomerase-like protein